MVRAILAGTKTQTRRLVKPQPYNDPSVKVRMRSPGVALFGCFADAAVGDEWICPFGRPGDRLWVRETWLRHSVNVPNDFLYRADHPDDEIIGPAHGGWKPSIHMPRWASRITLEITGVRVERLQEISEADAMAEGCTGKLAEEAPALDEARQEFRDLWESINGPGSWDANPWVWIVEFQRVQP